VLRARLLGRLEVEVDGTVVQSAASQRPWALFAYLALASRPVARAELIATFWPDVLEQSARGSLRSALWSLRRQIGNALLVEGDHAGLHDEDGVWVDAREFERLAASEPLGALELCRGELLEGFEEDWARSARERHHERVIELLEALAQAAERRDDPGEALSLTRRQVERDPFDEQAHRRLIERLAGAGDRAGAVRIYRALTERLRRDLGVAPSRVTRELIERLGTEPAPDVGVPLAPPRGLLPLVGRDHELRELERAWRSAAAGAGVAGSIRGEAGVGKTRLAMELKLWVSRAGALTATCAALELGGSAPLGLWAELIRELLPRLPAPPAQDSRPDDLTVLVSQLPAHFARAGVRSATIAPDLQRTRLFEAVVALLGWSSRRAPLLLVLEDIHSADGPSLELAAYAARRLDGMRLMILCTRRELPHSADADRLELALRARGVLHCELDLDPLAPDDGAALARSAARLSDREIARVVERAEGNPLLVVETARAVERGRDEIAPSLRGSARATLATLAGDVRRLVEVAAVAMRPLDPRETRTLGLSHPDEAAADALQTGLLTSSDGTIGFRHALLREAVYREIAEPRRRGLHQAWADALVAAADNGAISRAAEAARHLRLAGDDRRAVPHLVRAAGDARTVAALDEAVAYLEEALTITPDRADLWLELGELEAWRARREPSEAAFARATVQLEHADPLDRTRAYLRQARAYHGPICVPRAVLASARSALELVELIERSGQAVPDERSEAMAACAWAEAVAGSVEEADRLLDEISRLDSGSDRLRTYDVGHARALALMRRGHFTDSYEPSIAAGEAIAAAGRPDLAYGCWANAASAATAAGEHDRALEFIDRGSAAVAGNGLQSLEIHLWAARSFVLRALGRLAEARDAAETERTLAERLAQPELLVMASHDLGLVALAAGDYDTAATLLGESLLPAGAPISRPVTRLALAEALARAGQPDAAAEQLRATVLEPVRPSDFPAALVPRLTRIQGLIALARDDRIEAGQRLAEAIAGWERLADRAVRADSLTGVLADLGRPVVGLVMPEHELERARAELELIAEGDPNAVVP
jgi:DNA-binding SARP family transcriptional activator